MDRKQTPFPCKDRDEWPHEGVSLEPNWIERGPSFTCNPTKRCVMSWLPQPASLRVQAKKAINTRDRSCSCLLKSSFKPFDPQTSPRSSRISSISHNPRHNVPLYHYPQRSPLQHQRAPPEVCHRDCQGCRQGSRQNHLRCRRQGYREGRCVSTFSCHCP